MFLKDREKHVWRYIINEVEPEPACPPSMDPSNDRVYHEVVESTLQNIYLWPCGLSAHSMPSGFLQASIAAGFLFVFIFLLKRKGLLGTTIFAGLTLKVLFLQQYCFFPYNLKKGFFCIQLFYFNYLSFCHISIGFFLTRKTVLCKYPK